jgi:peptidoglycan hydrolase-like protein with peptidoglycan-binding domain
MPVIDGRIGPQTRNAILNFQRRNSHKLLSVDGVVHPAKYEGRVISLSGRLMTITLLDQFALDEALFKNDGDQIAGLVKLEPRLSPWLV